MILWILLWWLIGAVFLVGLVYADWRRGTDVNLGEFLLCFLWAICGPIIPIILLFVILKNKGMFIEIKRFFNRPIIKGKKQ